jgi:hypothetical protein
MQDATAPLRPTFATPHEQYAARNGQPFQLVAGIFVADDQHDEEVLPMFKIKFADGEMIEAWPDEIFDCA